MRRTILTFTTLLATLLLGSGVALAATIVGTNQADVRNGTVNRDVMYGLGGTDSLHGRGGNDEVDGGAGGDTNLSGGDGNDEVSGGSGNDNIYGGSSSRSGQNELYGGSGADTITADIPAAYDDVYAGSGNDTIYADDDSVDFVDCGIYSSPNSLILDSDTVIADRSSDGDPVNDVLYDCETVF